MKQHISVISQKTIGWSLVVLLACFGSPLSIVRSADALELDSTRQSLKLGSRNSPVDLTYLTVGGPGDAVQHFKFVTEEVALVGEVTYGENYIESLYFTLVTDSTIKNATLSKLSWDEETLTSSFQLLIEDDGLIDFDLSEFGAVVLNSSLDCSSIASEGWLDALTRLTDSVLFPSFESNQNAKPLKVPATMAIQNLALLTNIIALPCADGESRGFCSWATELQSECVICCNISHASVGAALTFGCGAGAFVACSPGVITAIGCGAAATAACGGVVSLSLLKCYSTCRTPESPEDCFVYCPDCGVGKDCKCVEPLDETDPDTGDPICPDGDPFQ